jgi:hypothetical protein
MESANPKLLTRRFAPSHYGAPDGALDVTRRNEAIINPDGAIFQNHAATVVVIAKREYSRAGSSHGAHPHSFFSVSLTPLCTLRSPRRLFRDRIAGIQPDCYFGCSCFICFFQLHRRA